MAGDKGKRRGNGDSRAEITGTKLELTLAAEQVFAEHGLNGATLRQIREVAGQKNESVIHYHFGSREAIIESVLHLRARYMDAERVALIARAQEQNNGIPLSSEQLSRCNLMPLAHYVLDSNEPGHYMRFLAQLRVDRAAWRRFSGLYDAGLVECIREMRRAKPNIPVSILNQRFLGMLNMHLSGMAAIEHIKEIEAEAFRPEEGWVRVEDLVASGAAVFDAPLSPETLVAIQRADAQQSLAGYKEVGIVDEPGHEVLPISHLADTVDGRAH